MLELLKPSKYRRKAFSFDVALLQPLRSCNCDIVKRPRIPGLQGVNDVADRESTHEETSRKAL